MSIFSNETLAEIREPIRLEAIEILWDQVENNKGLRTDWCANLLGYGNWADSYSGFYKKFPEAESDWIARIDHENYHMLFLLAAEGELDD